MSRFSAQDPWNSFARLLPHAFAAGLAISAFGGTKSPYAWVGASLLLLPAGDWAFGDAPQRRGATLGAMEAAILRCSPWLWIPIQALVLLAALWQVEHSPNPFLTALSLGVPAGMLAGMFGMTAAHELLHRRGRAAAGAATLVLTWCGYAHFAIAHEAGHHRLVGTTADAATARLGESVYAFLLRSIAGGWAVACGYEQSRAAFSPRKRARLNRLTLGTAAVLFWCCCAAVTTGVAGVLFFICQAAVAVAVLEVINYVQHYGLAASSSQPGYPNTWDCRSRLTNLLLMDIGFHTAHHRRQPRSRSAAAEITPPVLPAGYFLCFMLALCPALWMLVMDARLATVNRQFTTPQQQASLEGVP